MSPARKVAAWRTFRFSPAPTTISAPPSPDASTTSPAATGPIRTQEPRTGAAHGSPCAAPPAGTSAHASSTGARCRYRLMGWFLWFARWMGKAGATFILRAHTRRGSTRGGCRPRPSPGGSLTQPFVDFRRLIGKPPTRLSMLLGLPLVAAVMLVSQAPEPRPQGRPVDPLPQHPQASLPAGATATRADQPPVLDGRDDDAVRRGAGGVPAVEPWL